MKQIVRIGLLLVLLSAVLVATGSTGVLANECQSIIDEIGTQCGCPGGWYCG